MDNDAVRREMLRQVEGGDLEAMAADEPFMAWAEVAAPLLWKVYLKSQCLFPDMPAYILLVPVLRRAYYTGLERGRREATTLTFVEKPI